MSIINQPYYLFIKDMVTFILTAIGLWIACKGLATWKSQIKGTKYFETAYNLNYSILKLRDAVKYVRNPFIWSSESYKAIEYSKAKYPDQSAEDIKKNSNAYVYEMRWEKIADASTEMESHLLAAEVLWGPKILDLIKPLNKKINELRIYLQQYFQPEFRTKDYNDIHDIIYNKGDENNEDAFSKEIAGYIKNIEDYLKSKIS